MRAPEFWDRDRSIAAALLGPAALVVELAGWLRWRVVREQRVSVPVVCVGNLVAGGAGKTPVALAVAARLAVAGRVVHFLSRGYGGREHGPLRVDPARHTAYDVGDEALLLAAAAPTWVARDRPAGARAAAEAGAEVVVMDDGHQNPTLYKDICLVVIDGTYGVGNGRVIPAGPLREPVRAGLERADAVVLIGDTPSARVEKIARIGGGPLLWAQIVPAPESYCLANQRVVAFAGIARPDRFFDTLRNIGCRFISAHAFPDHYVYQADEIMALVEEASAADARLITTEKDLVRLPPEARPMTEVLAVSLKFRDANALDRVLARALDDG